MDQFDINKIWQNFVDTITNHYSDMSGRVNRAQYWFYVLVYALVGVGVAIIGSVVAAGSLFGAAYAVALFLPSVGMTARRLQDTGRSGALAWLWAIPVAARVVSALYWMFTIMTFGLGLIFLPLMSLVWLVALIAAVILVFFCIKPGDSGPNAYGPPPLWTASGTPRPSTPAV